MKLTPSPVAECAARHGLPVAKPASLRTPEALEMLRTLAPEVMVVAAYGLILPQPVLDVPVRGCINIHASLLPRWRGAAPIHRAILEGDAETGISIMRMEAGLDTGPVLMERRIAIAPDETTGTLTEKLATLGAEAIVAALAQLPTLRERPQDAAKASYAAKISKAEAALDWSRPAVELERKVRAFDPAPGAEAVVQGLAIKIWRARAHPGDRAAGEVVVGPSGVFVGCGSGLLELAVVQRPGARRMPVAEFLRGVPWSGTTMDHPTL
jgi:methionyl-tRNA formyltransferase